MQPKRLNAVTLPPLSFKTRERVYVRFVSELGCADNIRVDEKSGKPATTATVDNLEDGKRYTLIAPALAVSALRRYPGGYEGRCFEIAASKDKVSGKNYKAVDVYEIEDPGATLINVPKEKS